MQGRRGCPLSRKPDISAWPANDRKLKKIYPTSRLMNGLQQNRPFPECGQYSGTLPMEAIVTDS